MNTDEKRHEGEEHLDILNLPPRSEVQRKPKKKRENQGEKTESKENEGKTDQSNLFYHKLSIHAVLILFVLLIIGIPLYYYFVMP
ncbi:hypothetical protein [Alkalibacillus silvisoli]|uniref:Uncharacterized protein n=1 Tax=Alkalibacillus silvisoli TaxID=392823 RepID=A0ABN0ZTU7_9BACI